MKQLDKLRSVIRAHVNWLLTKVAGSGSITESELAEIKKLTSLGMSDTRSLFDVAYELGKMRATRSSVEYKNLTLKDVLDKRKGSRSSKEEIIIDVARLTTATRLKRLTQDIELGIFDHLSTELNEKVSSAVIQDIIRDETIQAIIQGKSSRDLSEKLAERVDKSWSRDWKKVATTELHSAKTKGAAVAIALKQDIYGSSEGWDSRVSVVPNKGACEDCKHHYLRPDGSPKVFILKDLVANGSNADDGVTHERKNGIHASWKTVLPPAHPNCFCNLVYLPAGTEWIQGRLQVVHPPKLDMVKKAVDTGSMSATIKPPGPPQKTTQPKVGNIKGQAAPSAGSDVPTAKAGSATAKAGSATAKAGGGSSGSSVKYEYWGKKGQPPSDGGWEQTESGAWRRPVGFGSSRGSSRSEGGKDKNTIIEEAKAWGSKPKTAATAIQHLSTGDITDIYELGSDDPNEAGINPSFRVTIDGNGRGIMKSGQVLPDHVKEGIAFTEGCGTVPHKTQPYNEVAAHKLFSVYGLDHCPPTTTRVVGGELQSVQAWQEGSPPLVLALKDKDPKKDFSFSEVIKMSDNPEEFRQSLEEITILDIVMNSQDRHMGNLVVSPDFKSVKAIDHGNSFGAGMMGTKSVVHRDIKRGGHKLKIPEKLKERLQTTSLGDLKRALGDHQQDWQVGQTFLRQQYVLHLQETEGHLDYDNFAPYQYSTKGDPHLPYSAMWTGDVKAKAMRHNQVPRSRPNEMFEDFAIEWMDKHSEDATSVHHAAAKELKDMGVFMGPGFAEDQHGYRSSGQHREYEAKIRKEKIKADKTKQKRPAVETPSFSDMILNLDLDDDDDGSNPVQATAAQGKMHNVAARIEARKKGRKLGKSLFLMDPYKKYVP